MSKTSLIIDNVAFAKKSERLEGQLTLEQCPRLAEVLGSSATSASSINYQLDGDTDSLNRPHLHLAIHADLTTTCQRCLEPMLLDLHRQYHYMVTEVESDEPEDSDDIDLQEPSISMDVAHLIEDEILMALPIAPTHSQPCGPEVTESGEKPNPFAVLKGLIKP